MTSSKSAPALLGRLGARGAVLLVLLLATVAAAVVVPLSAMSTDIALELVGVPDPGPVTTAGLPALRAIGELLAAVAVGTALFAAFFTPPQKDKTLDVDGYRMQQISSRVNIAWAVAAALLIPLTLSDVSGRTFFESLPPDQWFVAINQIDVASSWRWTFVIALVAAIGQRLTLSWRWSVIWLAVTVASLLPVAATGHASGSTAHDLATNSLIIHLFSAAFYVGGLVAVLIHTLRGGARVALALRRFSVVATVAIAALAFTGLINAIVRLHPADLFSSTYGLLVVAKALLLILLAIFGLAMRRRVIANIESTGANAPVDRASLLRIAVLESVVMAGTIGLSVSLGRTPPPAPLYVPTRQEALLGFELPGPFSFGTVFGLWRFDLILGLASVILLGLYLWGVFHLRRRGDSWPVGYTVFWVLGCVMVFLTTSSGMGMYMMADFASHMIGHMIISMLAPVMLALGGPLTLALRALPAAGRGNPPGPREWIVEFINNPLSRFLTHPIVATIQFVAGFYVVYFGGFYETLASEHLGHMFMNVHFLISGYLFYWVIIGVDAAPRQFTPMYRLMVLLGSLPFHAFFGILLMNYPTVLAEGWYSGIGLPWIPDLLQSQRVGGGVAWAMGEIPLFIVMVALGFQWYSSDMREARRGERQADRDDDAELKAYNEMLAQMAEGDRRP
ncbi:ABC transporter permease [Dietzia sp. NCCP-2495]|uniref:bifunctional copper resistance protein CopD/cytochrome c oxidase assembly protein n=1 Tax=Dietzia sp. NCCP-2495 TaxID=2934675 RepID=UPI00223002A3|nr:bifunctional copper resistance protein CopD/cytochrome c oxidase assembly protein [Dietzia sp. NCCP-2495]GLB62716.1 ABC transporter permease [Dietzia sp. NCCP-2495]